MQQIITFVPHGENLAGSRATKADVIRVLERLEQRLRAAQLTWEQVSLVMVANSKIAPSIKEQAATDQSIVSALGSFSDQRGWKPSLIGSSVVSSFFKSETHIQDDISDGLLFVAVVSRVLDRIPVSVEITRDRAERRHAGARAVASAFHALEAQIRSELNFSVDSETIAQTSTAIIFTMGSGHTEAQEFIDFKDCYAVGQELLAYADEVNAQVIGGCASNRSQPQLQCIYYSEPNADGSVEYAYTWEHAAVVAFLPYSKAHLMLQHPYKMVKGRPKLKLKFSSYEQYAKGRNFLVKSIDGQAPMDFLADAWGFTQAEMTAMVENHTAIPVEAKAHLVTFASSISRYDKNIWPNVPIWLERIKDNDEVLLRLVRAEPKDSNHYLMELKHSYLRENASRLMDSAEGSQGGNVTTLAFLCESRKYVLWDHDSNSEAEEMTGRTRVKGPVIGLYLNGEYSTGSRQSIGYHNYSQIGAFFSARAVSQLPTGILQARRTSGVELFVCHASADKPAAREFIGYVEAELPGSHRWIDERELKAGVSLRDEIAKVVGRQNQAFVPFITDRSVKSPWVETELRLALAAEQKAGTHCIFPVVLDDADGSVLEALEAAWGRNALRAIKDRLYVRVNDYSEREFREKASLLAEGIRKWREGGPSSHMPSMGS